MGRVIGQCMKEGKYLSALITQGKRYRAAAMVNCYLANEQKDSPVTQEKESPMTVKDLMRAFEKLDSKDKMEKERGIPRRDTICPTQLGATTQVQAAAQSLTTSGKLQGLDLPTISAGVVPPQFGQMASLRIVVRPRWQ